MRNNTSYIKNITYLYQVILWSLFYFVFHHAFFEEFSLQRGAKPTVIYTIIFIGFIVISLVNLKILLPRYYEKRKFKTYALMLFSLLYFSAVLFKFFTIHTLGITSAQSHFTFFNWIGYFFFFELLYVGLGSFFHFFTNWHKLRQDLLLYEKEKTNAELMALKAQINPHLLFNSLNNIYSFSLDKSDKTPELILKLSDLMSYTLYDCKHDKVTVAQELKFIKNYIEMEQTRFEDNITVEYRETIDDGTSHIAPLLLLPFIENAFKHLGSKNKQKPHIEISVTVKSKTLTFVASNTIGDESDEQSNPYSGIGIQNIKKRLSYLYPEQHELNITKDETKYKVQLNIEL